VQEVFSLLFRLIDFCANLQPFFGNQANLTKKVAYTAKKARRSLFSQALGFFFPSLGIFFQAVGLFPSELQKMLYTSFFLLLEEQKKKNV
jgi:hypothetical protein